jgi:hypothetical protein
MKKNKNEIIVETIINKMFEIAGHKVTFDDIKDRTDEWYQQWTMTEEQSKQWKEWGTDYLKKQKYLTKYHAGRQMTMFDFNYGLKINLL